MGPILFFDFGSPYAYLATERAQSVFAEPVELQPVLLGAIFKWRGHGSWADTDERPTRVAEIEQRAARYGLPPMAWPPEWPGNALAADRAAIWARQQGALEPFVRALFRHQFAEGGDIASEQVLASAGAEAGVDPAELLEAIQRPEIKLALRQATEEAWELGVRGVPSVSVAGTIFFGDDQLEEAAAKLA
jgi:2-hydroxychromene-2-carboxylate isomerase